MEKYNESLNNIMKMEHCDGLRDHLLYQYNKGYSDGYLVAQEPTVQEPTHRDDEDEDEKTLVDESEEYLDALSDITEPEEKEVDDFVYVKHEPGNPDASGPRDTTDAATETYMGTNGVKAEQQEEEEGEEEVMSKEMIDFYAATLKFKKERDAKKKENVYVNISSVDHRKKTEMTTKPPSLDVDKRLRHEKYAKHYGKMAVAIQSLETSLQLKYERCQDQRHGSKLWPHIPINITF